MENHFSLAMETVDDFGYCGKSGTEPTKMNYRVY